MYKNPNAGYERVLDAMVYLVEEHAYDIDEAKDMVQDYARAIAEDYKYIFHGKASRESTSPDSKKKLKEAVSEEEIRNYFDLLTHHNWFYEMRDVSIFEPSYMRSWDQKKEIVKLAKTDPIFEQMYEDMKANQYNKGPAPNLGDYLQ